jgi:hypothetical protein
LAISAAILFMAHFWGCVNRAQKILLTSGSTCEFAFRLASSESAKTLEKTRCYLPTWLSRRKLYDLNCLGDIHTEAAEMADDVRAVVGMLAELWRLERQQRKRRPTPVEFIVGAYATAVAMVDSEVGNCFQYLGAPGPIRSALRELSAEQERASRQVSDTALKVIEFLDEAGDSLTAKPASIALDRRVLSVAARHFHRHGEINERAIARAISVSHTTVNDRLHSRAARTLQRLHAVAPDIWSAKGRPLAEPIGSGRVLSDAIAPSFALAA